MLPAHQRLGADDAPAARVDERLVGHGELATLERVVQVALELQAAPRALRHVGLEEVNLPAARRLRVRHRRIGVVH